MTLNDILSNVEAAVGAGANYVLHLAAGAQQTVHDLEASNPLVGQAVALALSEAGAHGIPVPAIEALASATLALARALSTAGTAHAAAAQPVPAA